MTIFTTRDISVLFQGGLSDDLTQIAQGVRSARLAFPEAEIIVSAFEASADREPELRALGADVVVFSADPGALQTDLSLRPDNTNRMIVSSREGLTRATRPLCLKLRADALVLHGDILSRWTRMRDHDRAAGRTNPVFRDRLVANSLFSRRFYAAEMPAPYHVSDWQFFGWTEDVVAYFDVELGTEQDYARYFPDGLGAFTGDIALLHDRTFRMAPEEYVLAQTAARHGAPQYRDLRSATDEVLTFAEAFVRDNFLFLDPFTYGAIVPKYLVSCLNVAAAIDANDYGWNEPLLHAPERRAQMRPWPEMSFTEIMTRIMGPVRWLYCARGRPKSPAPTHLLYAAARHVSIAVMRLRYGARIDRLMRIEAKT